MKQDKYAELALNLRERDRQEIGEYGFTAADLEAAMKMPHVEFMMFGFNGKPAAAIWFDAITPKTLVASMMATDAWPKVARMAYRWCRNEAKPRLIAAGYTRAECRTMEGHEDAIRFLEHLGFSLECRVPLFGASGAAFLQYSWR